METWGAKELATSDLGDVRRQKRLVKIVEALAELPGCSVTKACQNPAAITGAYRFWRSRYFSPEEIRKGHVDSTVERIREHQTVLAIQDTTNIDVTHHPKTKEVGYLDHRKTSGLKVHSTLAISPEGVPLGIINQKAWARDPKELGKAQNRRQKETKDKESQRWLDALSDTEKVIPPEIQVITIADAEADIFDLLSQPRQENSELLIRGTHNRSIEGTGGKNLHQSISEVKPCGILEVEVKRNPKHEARQAKLTLRFATLEFAVPRHHPRQQELKPIKLQVILATEENPPQGVSGINWLLITTLEVNSWETAVQCVKWYSYRWLIERYHYTLKSGCGIEKLQLETGRRLQMALATLTIVAWRLLWLTYQARLHPDLPCDVVLETDEWQSLCATMQKNPVPPEHPPSLRQAVRWIAQLGGFLGRKGDGEPGVKTIWEGLQRLRDITNTWRLLRGGG